MKYLSRRRMQTLFACLTVSEFCLVLYQISHNSPVVEKSLTQDIDSALAQRLDDYAGIPSDMIGPPGCNVSIDSHEGMNGIDHTINKTEIKRQFFNFSSDLKDCNHISIPSDLFVPILVLSRDRVGTLKKSVESYQQTFATPYEIIVLDHNSTYPPMLEYIKRKQDEKQFTVHFLQSQLWDDALVESSRFIEQYLKAHPHAEYYVFTDPDIAFYNTRSDALLFFAANLASCSKIRVVGPGLVISDIPDHYKDKNPEKMWGDTPNLATWKGIRYHVVRQPIDTTFAMRRRKTIYARMQHGGTTLRAYAPYVATHTDWYLNSNKLPEDKVWYLNHLGVNRMINHY